MTEPTPIVLDTDIGTDVDDALALVFALASPEVELTAVTIVDGDVETRARMAARLLGMAGRPDIPVLVGEGQPMGPGRGPTWFGHEGRGLLDVEWDGPEAPILDQPAAEFVVEHSKTNSFRWVAVGPFTNVARAVQLDPELPARLLGLSVMGGMVHPEHYDQPWQQFFAETGLPPNHMDHNTASDVEAALVMARAGFDLTWVTAELTFCTTMSSDAMRAFAATGTALGDRLARMLHIWSTEWFHHIPRFPETARPFPIDAVAALHDPLAVASVFGGDGLTVEPRRLRFGISNELFDVVPIADGTAEEPEAEHRVSVAVDRARFNAFFEGRVSGFLSELDT